MIAAAETAQRDLSPREWQVLQRMLECKQNKEIAGELCIATKTVKFHAANIYKKVGVTNRTELIARFAFGR